MAADQKNILINKPQINVSYASKTRMRLISLCAILCIAQSSLNDHGISLILASVTVITGVIFELLFTWRKYGAEKIKDASAVVTALVLTIMLPNQINPVYAALGTVFAVIVVKYSFGGLGANWMNPALGGWLFMRFSWPSAFTSALEKGSTAINEISSGSLLNGIDNSVTEFLNRTVLSVTSINLPSGYIELLSGNSSSIIADRGLLFLLIGTIIITAAKINRPLVPLVFLFVFGFFIRIAGDSNLLWNGDIIYGFFSGGTAAAAFILSSEPASSTRTYIGNIFIAAAAAVLAWGFRYRLSDFTGCFTALALVNCFSPIIKIIEEKIFFPVTIRGN